MTNQTLISAARDILKKLLPSCSQPQINLFNRMYAHKHNASDEYYNNLSIDDVVDKMPIDKLDFAISQVERTIQKNTKQ